MSACCRGASCEQMFGPRFARRSLQRYRRKGLDDVERALVGSVAGDVQGASVLEIGGGVGALQAELLAAGAERGEVVELVAAYRSYARELAVEKGVGDRSGFRVLDLLEDSADVDRADVVVLNKVVCCSPDGIELTAAAGRLTKRALLLSYPRDVWWVRVLVRLENAGLWVIRRAFRAYVHRPAELVAAATGAGLVEERTGCSALWEWVVLRRSGA